MSSQTIEQPRVVSRDEWLKERVALLAREKQLTRDREELARQRRRLPWIRLDKEYVFEGYEGAVSLGELFNGRSQLIVYHFMFTPGWEYGCRSCSLMADHFDGSLPHLAARDVTLAAVSRAPFTDFDPFRQRMGWGFEWVSSHSSEFSYDYGVAFNPELIRSGAASYNFEPIPTDARLPLDDLPGLSVFHRGADGEIFHTYSAYARGLEPLRVEVNDVHARRARALGELEHHQAHRPRAVDQHVVSEPHPQDVVTAWLLPRSRSRSPPSCPSIVWPPSLPPSSCTLGSSKRAIRIASPRPAMVSV